jgi:16S rRNA (guanine527-N7)-methyltransferase
VSPLPHPDRALHDALTASQRSGFLGDRPIDQVIEHAREFVRALDGLEAAPGPSPADPTMFPDGGSNDEPSQAGPAPAVLDLGSGGGVPGLVIANDRPDLRITLLDRRAKRTDFLARVVSRLGWTDRVTVVCVDVDAFTPPRPFDAVVARGFGPPERTLAVANGLVRPGGRLVISEPPDADRWSSTVLDQLGVERLSPPGESMAVFRRRPLQR